MDRVKLAPFADDPVSRRVLVTGLAAGAMFGARGALAQSGELLTRRGTPQLTLGPFYPVTRPPEEDADLTTIRGRPGHARGPIIDISGQVLSESGAPVAGALLDIWQTNSAGRYHHPMDASDAPIDPAFQGAALLTADADGRYRFRTVLPGRYGNRERHIHFDVKGRRRRLITQMFFPGEPNASDDLFGALRTPALQAAATAVAQTQARDVPLYHWDIRLAGE